MDKVPFICIIKISTNFQLLKKENVLFKNRPAQAGQLNNFTFFFCIAVLKHREENYVFEVQII